MSNYSLVYCTDRELPEWLVVSGHNVVFKSSHRAEAECMLEEFRICEQGDALALLSNVESEWDYV